MSRMTAETLRVRLRDTAGVRRWMKSPFVKRLRRTRGGRRVDTWLLRRRALRRTPATVSLEAVATVALFIGHTKSGGSLLGAMLDAHPEIAMGDEVDIARLRQAGLDGDAMLAEFARSARREAMKGRVTARRLGGYSLDIPGWSQGSTATPKVIGNSRPGPTTRYLADTSHALEDLLEIFSGRRLRVLHVIRRPQDSIAAMVLRSGRDIVDAANDYAKQCERLRRLRNQLGESVCEVHYEEILESCPGALGPVLEFLGVEPPEGFLEACADLLDHDLEPESSRVSWNQTASGIIEESVHGFDFLSPYRG